jgi:hypothetical protein
MVSQGLKRASASTVDRESVDRLATVGREQSAVLSALSRDIAVINAALDEVHTCAHSEVVGWVGGLFESLSYLPSVEQHPGSKSRYCRTERMY